ncbi:MAG: XdhC family protein [Armatimonadota bacterium]|nr:XdhC family protein [Armatimonadota bacterium]MDR7402825.1 XdhC family protein [Armatimonadota bacterium]MDR7403963.1 XdhC family protein [Armatimonadota bacterium]MDR7436163.1 XdhC family protein [Armatimonadota bacterium]MDR7472042.1 XdhC family protein [Armatimonadota bacterium]
MKELAEILDAMERFARAGESMALATIVGVRGSTYRREGARLLLTRSQQMVGNISGGCLESDVMVVADEVMRTGQPRLVTYDLTADDDVVWGLGLGCNGAVDIFIEPVDPSAEVFGLYRRAIAEERPLAVVTVLGGAAPAGARLALWPDGAPVGTLGDPDLDRRAARAAAAALDEGASRVHTLAGGRGEATCFVEVLRPPIRLVVCGAGHDAIPVVQLAAAVGWRVVVADSRERFLSPQRFPGARQFVHAEPAEAARRVPTDRRTYVVIMTHNYLHDRDLLRGFLGTEVPYIGMLGPRARTEKILADLRRDGVAIADADLARIYGPVGLDVGADTPEEIALAVVGEIQAVQAGRRAGFLRERPGPIHQTVDRPTRTPGA